MGEILERVVSAVVPAVVSGVGAFVTLVRAHGSRLDALEKRLKELEEAPPPALPPAPVAPPPAAPGLSREEVVREARDAARGVAARAVSAVATQVQEARRVADAAMSRAEFTEYVDGDAERWERMTRALGVLEGSLQVVRDQLRPPR